MKHKRKKRGHSPDYVILFCIGLLVLFGLFMLNSASSALGAERFGDAYFYLKHQIFSGLSFGLIGFFLGYKIYYGNYKKRWVSIAFLVFTLLLLAAVFTQRFL